MEGRNQGGKYFKVIVETVSVWRESRWDEDVDDFVDFDVHRQGDDAHTSISIVDGQCHVVGTFFAVLMHGIDVGRSGPIAKVPEVGSDRAENLAVNREFDDSIGKVNNL